jgi:hypothetical protein
MCIWTFERIAKHKGTVSHCMMLGLFHHHRCTPTCLILVCPPRSHTWNLRFLYFTVSTLNPMAARNARQQIACFKEGCGRGAGWGYQRGSLTGRRRHHFPNLDRSQTDRHTHTILVSSWAPERVWCPQCPTCMRYSIVVLPAPSRPRINIRTSLSPHNRLSNCENSPPKYQNVSATIASQEGTEQTT